MSRGRQRSLVPPSLRVGDLVSPSSEVGQDWAGRPKVADLTPYFSAGVACDDRGGKGLIARSSSECILDLRTFIFSDDSVYIEI